MKYLVLGAGLQGRAAAFDLLRAADTDEVLLADASEASLGSAQAWLGARALRTAVVDAGDPRAVATLARGRDVVLSCVPYALNLPLARAAVESRCHFLDL